jgi:hypothetical protein
MGEEIQASKNSSWILHESFEKPRPKRTEIVGIICLGLNDSLSTQYTTGTELWDPLTSLKHHLDFKPWRLRQMNSQGFCH